MKDFRKMLSIFKDFTNMLECFSHLSSELQSTRLNLLVTQNSEGGLIPDNLKQAVEEFDGLIVWKTVNGTGENKIEVPEPRSGIDQEFDEANEVVNEIKEELEEFCVNLRKQYHNNRNISFSHAKQRYEIEIPEELVKGNKKPADFELCSQRQGF